MKRLIPVVVDRVIQQAIAQKLISIYENIFSNNSYGFRPNRSCHLAIEKALEYLDDGYNEEEIFKVANARLGWYKRCSMNVVNFILNPRVLNIKTKERPDLVNPLEYYLSSL